LLPSLAQLGVPPLALKEEVIRLFGLPESFAQQAPVEASAEQSAGVPVAGAGAGATSQSGSVSAASTPTVIGGV